MTSAKAYWRYCYDTPSTEYPPPNIPVVCIVRLAYDKFSILVCTVIIDLYTQQHSWVRHLSDFDIKPYAWLDIEESDIDLSLLAKIRATYDAMVTELTDDSVNSLVQIHPVVAP